MSLGRKILKLWDSLKNWIFRGVHEKPIYRGELPEKGGMDSLQRGVLAKKEGGGIFEEGLIPQCTLCSGSGSSWK